MAKDTAAASFAARTPIAAMDRPSVERELRHVHGDMTYYSTAHAARDALAAARAQATATEVPPPPAEPRSTPVGKPRITVEHTQAGTLVHGTERDDTTARAALKEQGFKWSSNLSAWYLPRTYRYETRSERVQALARTLGDQVTIGAGTPDLDPVSAADTRDYGDAGARPADDAPQNRSTLTAFGQAVLRAGPLEDSPDAGRSGPTPDTSGYPSAQRYPIGSRLTVHAVTDDGTTGRRLGHGVVTDHPGPEHVTVESPYGTRRVAHLDQVSQPNRATSPTSNSVTAQPPVTDRSTGMPNQPGQAETWPPPPPGAAAPLPDGYHVAESGVPGVPPKYQVLHGTGRSQQFIGIRDTKDEAVTLAHQHQSRAEAARAAGEQRMKAAEDRWADDCRAVDPRVVADPHWPTLARSLDRLAAAGHDVRQLLREVTAQRALPATNPARSLDYRLADVAPDATAAISQPWTAAPTAQPSAPSAPANAPQLGRGGPAR